MRIHTEFEQGSAEWLTARAGVVTASEFKDIMTPLFKARDGETPKSYLAKKLAEKWTGTPMGGFQSIDMEFGQILEQQARDSFIFETGLDVTRAALIISDDGKIGCSPDGLIGEDGGVEIKCPRADTHVRYLLNGVLPPDYAAQVHGSIYVSGRPWWRFMSFCRGFPPLLLTIERDEKIQALIDDALTGFLEQFDAGWNRLVEINGAPPRPRYVPQAVVSTTEPKRYVEDIIP